MISFRLPWYALSLGAIVVATACLWPFQEAVKLPIFLAGTMLVLDGALGVRTLPCLTPHASFPEDWRRIEQNLYFGTIGLARGSIGVFACVALAAFTVVFGDGDWRGWSAIAIIIGFGVGWLFAALRAIRDTMSNGN